MISYTLKCDNGHRFDSWFQSASAFDTLKNSGHLSCAQCGSAKVEKAIMAPSVTASRDKPPAPAPAAPKAAPELAATAPAMPEEMRAALKKLKEHVEKNSEYVGRDFTKQARDMYLGDVPERPIYGEVTPADAKGLVEDGVPILPLPFTPSKKAN